MRRLGDRSFFNLVSLWSFVAMNKPDGNLSELDAEDIEIAADWEGDGGLFFKTLIELKFIDKSDDGVFIHDWKDHNGFASHSKERSEKAKMAAETRWKNAKTFR